MEYLQVPIDLLQGLMIGVFSYQYVTPKHMNMKMYHIAILSLIIGFEILYFDFTTVYESFYSLFYVATICLYLKITSNNSFLDVFLLAVIIITITSVGNGLAIFIFCILLNISVNALINSETMLFTAGIISTLFTSIILYLIIKAKNYVVSFTESHGGIFTVSMINLHMSITLLEEMVFSQSYNEMNLLICLMLFLIVFILLLLIMFKNASDILDYIGQEMIVQELNHLSDKSDTIEESNNEVRVMKHDMNKTLFVLKDLINEGKIKEVNTIIDEMITDIQLAPKALISGISSIDSVISSKAVECSSMQIKFTYNVDTSCFARINDYDLSLILLNALSNAIENVDPYDKSISLEIIEKRDVMSIQVINKVNNDVFKENPQLTTNKKNKNHGYGIKSMRNIARKYKGDIHLYQIDNSFHCIINLQIPESITNVNN